MRTLRFVLALVLSYSVLGMAPARAHAPRHLESAPAAGGNVNSCTLAALQTALAGGGVVTFNCSGTIIFTSPWIVTANTTINGNGFPVTLSGGNSTYLFQVNAGVKLSINQLTIQNGLNTANGGCIRAFGNLDVSNSTIRYCKAMQFIVASSGGAVYATGSQVNITNSTFFSNSAQGNGGAIYAISGSDLSFEQAILRQNSATNGGGLHQTSGSAIFYDTDVLSNTAELQGGGIYANNVPSFNMYASQVAYNQATDPSAGLGGGAYFTKSAPYLDNAIILSNDAGFGSGGLYAGGGSSLAMYHGVISGNVASGDGPGGMHIDGGSASMYTNLFQENDGYPYGGALRNSGYINSGSNQFINNHGYYGGGILNEGGKTLDVYNTSFISNTGAYGAAMRNDGTINYGMNLTFTGNTATYEGGALYSPMTGARTQFTTVVATQNTATYQEGGVVYLRNGYLSVSDASITKNKVGLHGAGFYIRDATLKATNADISENATRNITDVSSGIAIYATGNSTTTLQNVKMNRNQAEYLSLGAALHLEGKATMNVITISNNTANNAAQGGGIYLLNGNATLKDAVISENTGMYSGGGIQAEDSFIAITNTTIRANHASAAGGGIYAINTTMPLSNVVIRDHNSGINKGGGIECYTCSGHWQYITLSRNNATSGGGAHLYGSPISIEGSLFEKNSSATDGGGLSVDHHPIPYTVFITNTTFSGNISAGSGGGVFIEPSTQATSITMTNVTLKDNGAVSGGSVYVGTSGGGWDKARVSLRNTVLADPASGGNCGGKPISSAFYSLSADFTCSLTSLSATNKVDGTPANLGALWFNGGYNKTHMPLAGSVLIDGVSGAIGPTKDQRTVGRPQGLGFDIGAVEVGGNPPFYADAFRAFLPNTLRNMSAGW